MGPGDEQQVVEDNGDTDGDIPAEASEADDEINTNIDRDIPAETSESDDEDVQDAQMPEDVPCSQPKTFDQTPPET